MIVTQPTCSVELYACDALAVGLSIRTLVRGGSLPIGTAEIYRRVAEQMISAARVAATPIEVTP